MSLLAKIFVVLQTILVMVYLGMTATLYQHRQDWRSSYRKLKHRYSTMVARSQKEIKALRSYVRAKDDLVEAKEREVRALKTQLDVALEKYQEANTAKDELSGRFDQLQANFNGLNTRLEDNLARNESLNDRLEKKSEQYDVARQRRETAEGQVARLTALTTNLEQDLKDLRKDFAATRQDLREKDLLIAMAESQGVNLELLVPGPPVPSIDGRVMAVKNDMDPPLVLLSVGSDDKVQRGYHFSVYRGANFVGKVVVERVLRDSAGCRVLFTAEGQSIQSGDNAATRLYD